MEHEEALQTNATERYLLDEMAAGERDAFEDHYFDCSTCAADVRDTARMMAAGRQVARESATIHTFAPKQRQWSSWVPQAAAAAIITGVAAWFGALSTMEPRKADVDVGPSRVYHLPMSQVRAASTDAPLSVRVPGELSFEVLPHDDAASFVYSIRDSAGRVLLSEPVTLEESAEPVYADLRTLPRGRYEVVIEGVRKGGNRFPITSAAFVVVGER